MKQKIPLLLFAIMAIWSLQLTIKGEYKKLFVQKQKVQSLTIK